MSIRWLVLVVALATVTPAHAQPQRIAALEQKVADLEKTIAHLEQRLAAIEANAKRFDVVLTAAGARKLEVIKVIRTATGFGLAAAKDIVDRAPRTVRQDLPLAEAEKLKTELVAAGATAEVKPR
jgi:ribosomal protein L7/L12